MNHNDIEVAPTSRQAWIVFLPLVLFVLLAGLFVLRLGAGDASRLPSALIGKSVPAFALAPIEGIAKPGLSASDLKNGNVTVINFFASWCGPCRQEAAALLLLSQQGLPLVGIAYKDKPENTRRFLADDGDPFRAIGADLLGHTGIDFGVYGVPETYVVDGRGIITDKIVGPLTEDVIRDRLMPAVAGAREKSSAKR